MLHFSYFIYWSYFTKSFHIIRSLLATILELYKWWKNAVYDRPIARPNIFCFTAFFYWCSFISCQKTNQTIKYCHQILVALIWACCSLAITLCFTAILYVNTFVRISKIVMFKKYLGNNSSSMVKVSCAKIAFSALNQCLLYFQFNLMCIISISKNYYFKMLDDMLYTLYRNLRLVEILFKDCP